ncbi:MAG: Phage head-tail joining protein [Pseudomonadota bacterium]|jgi:SPP1 family predicted phage head-tail adaptor
MNSKVNINLNKKILIQKEIITLDDGGGYSSTWQDVAVVWANFVNTSSNNITTFLKNDASKTYVIEIRYNKNIEVGQKILFEAREFLIKQCTNPEEDKIRMILVAEEIVNSKVV